MDVARFPNRPFPIEKKHNYTEYVLSIIITNHKSTSHGIHIQIFFKILGNKIL